MRLALIGLGYWGRKIAHVLKETLHHDFVIIRSRDESFIRNILSNEDITHVLVATPVKSHYQLVKTALLLGKHVMCEKNFTETYEQAQELCTLAGKKKRNLLVNFIYTFNPVLQGLNPGRKFTICITQYGQFREEPVMSMLGSHALSIAHQFTNIDHCYILDKKISNDEANVIFRTQDCEVTIEVSRLKGPEKIRELRTIDNVIDLRYDDGIQRTLENFLTGYHNEEKILAVARCLEVMR